MELVDWLPKDKNGRINKDLPECNTEAALFARQVMAKVNLIKTGLKFGSPVGTKQFSQWAVKHVDAATEELGLESGHEIGPETYMDNEADNGADNGAE